MQKLLQMQAPVGPVLLWSSAPVFSIHFGDMQQHCSYDLCLTCFQHLYQQRCLVKTKYSILSFSRGIAYGVYCVVGRVFFSLLPTQNYSSCTLVFIIMMCCLLLQMLNYIFLIYLSTSDCEHVWFCFSVEVVRSWSTYWISILLAREGFSNCTKTCKNA